MSVDGLKQDYLMKFLNNQDKFCRDLLVAAITKLVLLSQENYKGPTPELEYLEDYNQFLILYRREGNKEYLDIANLFRKVAHRVYRIMLKKGMTTRNLKFLNSV